MQYLGDLPPAPAGAAQLLDGIEVHGPPGSADGLARAGAARGLHPGQPGTYPVANQLPLELGEGGDEMHEEPARRGAEVDGLAEADHDAAGRRQLVEQHQQVPEAAAEPVEPEHQHLADGAGTGSGSEAVERRPARLRPAVPQVDRRSPPVAVHSAQYRRALAAEVMNSANVAWLSFSVPALRLEKNRHGPLSVRQLKAGSFSRTQRPYGSVPKP